MRRLLKIIGIVLVAVIVLVGLLLVYFNLPGPPPRQDVKLGVTFSYDYAQALGLDWKEAYVAMLDDLQVKEVRLPVYWNLTEPKEGEYDFSVVDWQLEETRKRNAHVILAIGQKVPRWPECFIPDWANHEGIRQRALLSFLDETVSRYKDHEEITVWQIENEPFLTFGVCPKLDVRLLENEIALVKHIDSTRPVMVTDSGELSTWLGAAKRGDRFGTTMYRNIWKKGIGYFEYPLGPNFFLTKAFIAKMMTGQKHFSVIELQAEPWASDWIAHVPLAEQFQTMNEHRLRENVEYAKRVGFPEVYLWGVEWWYWLKVEKQYPAVWDEAKKLFLESTD